MLEVWVTTTIVSSAAALNSALKVARAGDVIQLTSGEYGMLKLYNYNGGGVTITSVDADHPAVFSGINVQASSGLNFSNLEVKVDPNTGFAVYLAGVKDVQATGMNLHGSAVGDGNAAMVRGSTNVSITNSEIHDLANGINHLNSKNLVFSGNNIHDIRIDGIRGAGSSDITISKNTFTNFRPQAGDHPDAIQFWTAGTTTAAKNITITDNTFVRGDGAAVQGIFVGNEAGIAYENLKITGNAIVGGMYQGIMVYQANGAVIEHNLVQGYADMNSWIMVGKTTNSVLANNTASAYQMPDNVSLSNISNTSVKLAAVGDTSQLSAWQGTAYVSPTYSATPAAITPTVDADKSTVAQPAPTGSQNVVPTDAAPGQAMTGSRLADNLKGASGNDTIDGGAGADSMAGGAGDDVYTVDNANDKIIELSDSGIDTVKTTLAFYAAPENVENVTLTAGSSVQAAWGNELGNVLRSNGHSASLYGEAGNDTLVANSGYDRLTGGAGEDVFRFEKAKAGSITTVTDFTRGADKLDLDALLSNYHGANPLAEGWLQFKVDGSGTTILVDVDGPTGSAGMVTFAKLAGYTGALSMGSDWVF
jgi:Ca2+-binding RTX toxin-like protein